MGYGKMISFKAITNIINKIAFLKSFGDIFFNNNLPIYVPIKPIIISVTTRGISEEDIKRDFE